MEKGILYVISGPSGAGKGTIVRRLLQELPHITYSVSATTRPPRPGEEGGKDYFFLSEAEFKKKIKSGELLEWAEVHGYYYGTPRSFVNRRLAAGQDVLLEIDPQGAYIIKKKCPEAIFIFIAPPSLAELRHRLLKRGTDGEDDIKVRLHNAKKEMAEAGWYDYIITNNQVKDAVIGIKKIMTTARGDNSCAKNRFEL